MQISSLNSAVIINKVLFGNEKKGNYGYYVLHWRMNVNSACQIAWRQVHVSMVICTVYMLVYTVANMPTTATARQSYVCVSSITWISTQVIQQQQHKSKSWKTFCDSVKHSIVVQFSVPASLEYMEHLVCHLLSIVNNYICQSYFTNRSLFFLTSTD